MAKKLLTFETNPECDQVEIHGNREGLVELIDALKNAIDTSRHNHLMTPSWGGTELTEHKQGQDSRLVNKVTVHFWEK